jgi:hypothetical protein
MVDDKGLAARALHDIAKVWEVEKDRSDWSEDGFDWWPGDFRVSVRAQTDSQQRDPGTWRLLVKTDFLKDVPVSERHFTLLVSQASRFMTSTYACAYYPHRPERSESGAQHNMWFASCAYLNKQNADFIPAFLAQTAIMQPVNAQLHSEFAAELFKGGTPNKSRPPHGATAQPNPVLEIAAQVYVPIGKEQCRWIGTSEFTEFAERYALNDNCFGSGSATGLTVETPFGSDSALIRLLTDQEHPQLGNGLVAMLHVPIYGDENAMAHECEWLNFLEASSWTGVPLFGCWQPYAFEAGEGQKGATFTSLMPNALYRPGLAANMALWMIYRARWLRQTRWPDREDKTMMEIIKGRDGFPSS